MHCSMSSSKVIVDNKLYEKSKMAAKMAEQDGRQEGRQNEALGQYFEMGT